MDIPNSEVFESREHEPEYQITIWRNHECMCQSAWLNARGVQQMRIMICNLDSSFQCRIKTRRVIVTEAPLNV